MRNAVFFTLSCVFTAALLADSIENHVSRINSLIEPNNNPALCALRAFNRTFKNDNIDEITNNVVKDGAKCETAENFPKYLQRKNSEDISGLVDFPLLNSAVSLITDQECREHAMKVVIGLMLKKPWAIQMYNASAKSFQVLLSSSSYDLGDYDKCFNIVDSESKLPIETQYCLASIKWNNVKEKYKVRTGRGDVIRWAICVPKACRSDDVRTFIDAVMSRTSEGNSTSVELTEKNCSSKRPVTINQLNFFFMVFCLLLGIMLVTGTLYDWLNCGKQTDSLCSNFIMSFSMINNIKKITNTKQNTDLGLEWASGIKTLAMIATIGGHATLFIISGPVKNPETWDEFLRSPKSTIILNSNFLVDTFFFMSAFLFSYLLLVELEKKRGRVNITMLFIFRFIRMAPAYLFIMLFYMTWFPKIGAGPLWNEKLQLEQERCLHSWWTNILFINNYVNTDTFCMFQSWYLAVDTQLALVAPFYVYALWRFKRAAPKILTVSIILSGIVPAVATYVHKLDPTLMFYAKEFSDFGTNFYFKEAYIKTELRTVTYIIGIATGYILYQIRAKNYVFSRNGKVFGWTITIILLLIRELPITIFYQDWYEYNAVEAAAYISLQKLVWSIINGWFMLSLTTGGGGWIRSFLTWKLFVPVSKIAYCAYLMNVIVELVYIGRLREPLHLTFTSVTTLVFAHIFLTFVGALLLSVTFESPINGAIQVLLSRMVGPDHKKKGIQEKTQSINETEESTSKHLAKKTR